MRSKNLGCASTALAMFLGCGWSTVASAQPLPAATAEADFSIGGSGYNVPGFGSSSVGGGGAYATSSISHDTKITVTSFGVDNVTDFLQYDIEVDGPTPTVTVDYVASLTGTGTPSPLGVYQVFGGNIQFTGNDSNVCFGFNCTPNAPGGPSNISINQLVTLETGIPYTITIALAAEGEDSEPDGHNVAVLGTATLDPTFTVMGAAAADYTISYSDGIVPEVSAVSETESSFMLLAGIALLAPALRRRLPR